MPAVLDNISKDKAANFFNDATLEPYSSTSCHCRSSANLNRLRLRNSSGGSFFFFWWSGLTFSSRDRPRSSCLDELRKPSAGEADCLCKRCMGNICKKQGRSPEDLSISVFYSLFVFFSKELSLHVTFLEFAFAFKFCSFKKAGPAGWAGLHVHEVPQLRAGRDKPSWSKTPDALTAISSATQGLSAAVYQRIRDQNQGLLSPCSDSTLVAHFKCLRGLPMFVRLWCGFWTVQ